MPFAFVVIFYLIVAIYNVGFIAIDDYMHGISLYIPAQLSTYENIIQISDFRSPLPNLFLLLLSKTALFIGINDAIVQFRFVLFCCGLLGLLSVWSASKISINTLGMPSKQSRNFIAFMCLCPLFLTRPLIEAMAASFLTLAAFFLMQFENNEFKLTKRNFCLALSLFFLGISATFRPQVGAVLPTYLFLIFSSFNILSVITFILSGIGVFILTGLPDYFMKGSLHNSLKSYLAYNLESSHIYGVSPFWIYLLMILGLSIPFMPGLRGLALRETYLKKLKVPFLFSLFFIIAHSMIAHKEERFMVPILPLLLVLAAPAWLIMNEKAKVIIFHKKYLSILMGLNLLLVFAISFNPPQINSVRLVRFLNRTPNIKEFIQIRDADFVFPAAFLNRELKHTVLNLNEMALKTKIDCTQVVGIRYDIKETFEKQFSKYKRIFTSTPGPLEHLVVTLNPNKNARRGPLLVYSPIHCDL